MDYYAVLGLDSKCSDDDVKAQYRRLARVYHPDVNPDDAERSTQRQCEINEAYEVLSDPARREEYDSTLADRLAALESGQLVTTGRRSTVTPASIAIVMLAIGFVLIGIVAYRVGDQPPATAPELSSTFFNVQKRLDNSDTFAARDAMDRARDYRKLSEDVAYIRPQIQSILSDGDTAYASLNGEVIDGLTPAGAARKGAIARLGNDLQVLHAADLSMESNYSRLSSDPGNVQLERAVVDDITQIKLTVQSVTSDVRTLATSDAGR